MDIELRELSINDGKDVYDMIQEIGPGENGFDNGAFGLSLDEFISYLDNNIKNSKGIDLKPDHVPQTVYWLFIDGRPVGICKLRHCLNDKLLKSGGNIGYCIRPSERGKGYGNVILKEVLKKAGEKGIRKALVTVDVDNVASRKVAEYNGGQLENIVEGKCRYWVPAL